MPYLTEGAIENFMLQDIDNSFSGFVTSIIGYVEAYIDNYCGTDFQNSGADTKRYDGTGLRELFIGEFQSLSAVRILTIEGNTEDTLTENTDFWTYPLNETVKNTLYLIPTGSYAAFPKRARSVECVGTFGRTDAPEPVKLAGLQMCAKIINEGLRGGQVSAENLGSYSVDYRQVDEVAETLGIKDILNQYRVMTLF